MSHTLYTKLLGSFPLEHHDMYDRSVALVTRERKVSVSLLQRHLQIGYNRAAMIIEEMQRQGVVSPMNAVGKRKVLALNISETYRENK